MLALATNVGTSLGCVRLASPGQPCSAHPGEPLTRTNRTITLALSWWCQAPRASPKWPIPQAGHLVLTQVSPWNDFKAIWTYLGQTRVDPGKLIEHTLRFCSASHGSWYYAILFFVWMFPTAPCRFYSYWDHTVRLGSRPQPWKYWQLLHLPLL